MSYLSGDILLNKYRIEALIGNGGEVYRDSHLGLKE